MPLNLKRKTILVIAVFFGMLVSCDSKRVFDENIIIGKNSWDAGNKMKFNVVISNIEQSYNVYLKVRNTPAYPYSNLFLFLNTRFPDGRVSRDTLELTLADYDGRWLGSGIGSMKFSKFLIQKGVRFREPGPYCFELEQAMRVRELQGIGDIGLRVEKQ